MPRPMALGLVILVLFLTSRSEWQASHSRQMEAWTAGRKGRGRPLEAHLDTIREKIILDLTAESKHLEDQNRQLQKIVEGLEQEAQKCKGLKSAQTGPNVVESEPHFKAMVARARGDMSGETGREKDLVSEEGGQLEWLKALELSTGKRWRKSLKRQLGRVETEVEDMGEDVFDGRGRHNDIEDQKIKDSRGGNRGS